MRLIVCVLLGLVLLLVQGLLYHLGVPAWCIPQGLLVCVVFLAFYEGSVWGAVCAFVLGLLLDMNSAIVLGPWAGAYTLVYLLLTMLSQRLFVESPLVAMAAVAFATLLGGAIFLVLGYEYQTISSADFVILLGQSATSACIAPVVFAFLAAVWKRVGAISSKRGSALSAV